MPSKLSRSMRSPSNLIRHFLIRHVQIRRGHDSSDAGMSLIEVSFASVILLFVATSLLPLFVRSSFNNISGDDSTQASQHSKSQQEGLLTELIDDQRFDLSDPLPGHTIQTSTEGTTGDEMLLRDLFWDSAAGSPDAGHQRVGDGDWIIDPGAGQGIVFWRRRSVIRQYTYADIADGVINAANPNELATLGNARLFDRPLNSSAEASLGHFKEQEVQMESQRAGGEILGASSLRTRILRTF